MSEAHQPLELTSYVVIPYASQPQGSSEGPASVVLSTVTRVFQFSQTVD